MFVHPIVKSHRQFRSPVVIHHVQQWVRFSKHINTDYILKAHTKDRMLRRNEEVILKFKCKYINYIVNLNKADF